MAEPIPASLAAALDALGLPARLHTPHTPASLSLSQRAALTGISASWSPRHSGEEPPF